MDKRIIVCSLTCITVHPVHIVPIVSSFSTPQTSVTTNMAAEKSATLPQPKIDLRVESVSSNFPDRVIRPGDNVRGRILVASDVSLHFSRVDVSLIGRT